MEVPPIHPFIQVIRLLDRLSIDTHGFLGVWGSPFSGDSGSMFLEDL